MRVRHAFTGQIYELEESGVVKVTDPTTGDVGLFDSDGEWISGAMRSADFHLVRHVGGARAPDNGFF